MNEPINPYTPPSAELLTTGHHLPSNSEIMSRAWRIYRDHFAVIAITICIIWVPCEVLSSYMDAFVFGEEDFRRSFKFAQLLENFFGIIATAGVIQAARCRAESGVTGALACGMKRWPGMWWARFVTTLMCLASLLLLVVPFFYLYPRLMLVESILVSEEVTALQAIRRSMDLVRGHYWQIVRLLLLLMLVVAVPVVLFDTALAFEVIPDQWQFEAAGYVISDVVSGYGTVCLFCLYDVLSGRRAGPRHAGV